MLKADSRHALKPGSILLLASLCHAPAFCCMSSLARLFCESETPKQRLSNGTKRRHPAHGCRISSQRLFKGKVKLKHEEDLTQKGYHAGSITQHKIAHRSLFYRSSGSPLFYSGASLTGTGLTGTGLLSEVGLRVNELKLLQLMEPFAKAHSSLELAAFRSSSVPSCVSLARLLAEYSSMYLDVP